MSDLDKYEHATNQTEAGAGLTPLQGDRAITSMPTYTRDTSARAVLQSKGTAHRRRQRGGSGCAGDGTLCAGVSEGSLGGHKS